MFTGCKLQHVDILLLIIIQYVNLWFITMLIDFYVKHIPTVVINIILFSQ
jgi:hypothetical protein